jgi:AraC-like DNA-binding protein
MDPLSDVLRVVRMTGAFFYLVEASAPWSVAAAPATELAPRILPGSEHLISYHIVTSGRCWGGLEPGQQLPLEAGDVIVFPHGDAHFLSSERGRHVGEDALGRSPDRYPGTVHLGQGASDATFVCGFLGCDTRPFNPLIAALPKCLRVSGGVSGWLAEFPRQVVAESRLGRIGADTMLTRMAELMFVEVVRRHIETLVPEQKGWLAGLRDPTVGVALARLHASPSRGWTLAELAHEVGASRTVLAERFAELVGVPPMQYLTQWRLQLAASLLATTMLKVAAIGEQVGYESEAAFSRAFKRAIGRSPAEFRRQRHESASPPPPAVAQA